MSQDSTFKTIGVATGICLFCSLFVSVAAVKLSARQQVNKQLDKIKNILQVADLVDSGEDPMQIFRERIMPVLVDLKTGKPVPQDKIDEKLDPNVFDVKALADNPKYSHEIPADQDIAGIRRQTNDMVIYELKQGDAMEKLILPIYGKGLWSTLYGFLALEKDLETVSGITFYEHAETPGLGGEVDNPKWKASWKGKQAFDSQGDKIIHVIKGQINPASAAASHQIDGLSGATLTTRGVDNFIQFWLGDNGYGPFLKQLREAQKHE